MNSFRDSVIARNDLETLNALHYYSSEHPGSLWGSVPDELVRAGIIGLENYIRALRWGVEGKDPYEGHDRDNPQF